MKLRNKFHCPFTLKFPRILEARYKLIFFLFRIPYLIHTTINRFVKFLGRKFYKKLRGHDICLNLYVADLLMNSPKISFLLLFF